jgi:FlaA1/EpsC-like NDP-sugar epimerase
MTRFFMTIPEAVALIVQAGAFGDRGHLFVLDMGEPVKILDLAKEMIRLSGKKLDADIPIQITGARPGEKVHEELWGYGERIEPTSHPAILRASRPALDYAWLLDELAALEALAAAEDRPAVLAKLRSIVAESGRMNGEADTGPAGPAEATAPQAVRPRP